MRTFNLMNGVSNCKMLHSNRNRQPNGLFVMWMDNNNDMRYNIYALLIPNRHFPF